MRRLLLGLISVGLGVPVAAWSASSASVTVALSPDRPAAASALSFEAHGPVSPSGGLPTRAALRVQPGFASSPRSVRILCSPSQAGAGTCPAPSRIGTGTAVATGTVAGLFSQQDTISFTLFLGSPLRRGDIASVVVSGTDSLLHQSAHATGRLFKPTGGGLELLFDPLPKFSPPAGAAITLDRLSLSVHAVRTLTTGNGRHRRHRRYSLITNPASCPGSWVSTATLSFTSGAPLTRSLAVPCHRR